MRDCRLLARRDLFLEVGVAWSLEAGMASLARSTIRAQTGRPFGGSIDSAQRPEAVHCTALKGTIWPKVTLSCLVGGRGGEQGVGAMRVRAFSIVGLLFATVVVAAIPVSPQVTPRGLEISVDQAQAVTYRRARVTARRVDRRTYRHTRRAVRRGVY